ncbi:transcriptional regulator [Actinomadura craniellae]|uniref:Transcriptional regulator n=1 Tax=Actinomadura craniellae TaxID=2231787 RepID=A0A365GWF0_9ACTN|nr:helix-turn-helix domain-containing protein [Actinomadura craniellae]RAY11135.1 transcriptional regulator [Actinomadura craniellae]
MDWLQTSAENCTVRRTLDIVGEKWTLLILRDTVNGVRRFDDLRRHIGVSETILADRLRKLVGAGILERRPYREPGRRTRWEYRVTPRGWELWPVLIALMQWGDRYTADPEGPPLNATHHGCGAPLRAVVECAQGHGPLGPREAEVQPGPSARPFQEAAADLPVH